MINWESIKQGFSEMGKVLAKHYKFVDVKAKDGTILRYEGDTPQAGMRIEIVSAEGLMPVPDGDVELEDGTLLVVKDSTIVDVKAPVAPPVDEGQAAAPAAPAEPAKATPKKVVETKVKESTFTESDMEQLQAITKQIEGFNAEITALKQAIEALSKPSEELASVKAEMSAMDKLNKQMFEIVKNISEQPDGKTATEKKAESKPISFEDSINEFRSKHKL